MVWESFGPIIGIQEVRDDEEAVNLMNDTKYGLTAAVYTQSKDAAENILARVNSGTGTGKDREKKGRKRREWDACNTKQE